MAARVLVVQLVPIPVFERLIEELRKRHPGAHVTALAIGEVIDADEALDWRKLSRRQASAALRGRQFDLLVVAHGRDHYASRAYWKALALALASGARRKRFCAEGKLPGRGLAAALLVGAVFAGLRAGQEVVAAVTGLLVLSAALVLAAVTDLTEALLPVGRTRGRPKTR
jgi:hypothetical protein